MRDASASLEAAAARFTSAALTLIRRDGLTEATLCRIGDLLSDLAALVPEAEDTAEEVAEEIEIRSEPDGTFELLLCTLGSERATMEALAYDTWSVFAPCQGRIELKGPRLPTSFLAPGTSKGFVQDEMIAVRSVSRSARLLRLFGVARAHLPPPRRDYL